MFDRARTLQRLSLLATLGVAIGALVSGNLTAQVSERSVFVAAEIDGPVPTRPGPAALQSRFVTLRLELLGGEEFAMRRRPIRGSTILLELFPELVHTAVLERFERAPGGGYAWLGQIVDDPGSSVAFAVLDGHVEADISTSAGFFRVEHVSERVHRILEVDPEQYPDEHAPLVPSLPEVRPEVGPDATHPAPARPVIDVMVLFTPGARIALGGKANIRNRINLGVALTNRSFRNSGVDARFRLVHRTEIPYSELGFDWEETLERLALPNDGFMDDVHALRREHGADLVSLVVNDPALQACGIGYVMPSWSAAGRAPRART